MRQLLLILFVVMAVSGLAQRESPGLDIEIASGATTGWWVYNRGSSDPAILNDQGYDRTHHCLFLPATVAVLYRHPKFRAGLTAEYLWMFEDKMFRNSDRVADPERIKISDGFVKIMKIGLQAEYVLFHRNKYILAPGVKGGVFEIKTLHPEQDNFGTKLYGELFVTNEFLMNDRLSFIVRPTYKGMSIAPKTQFFEHQRHSILHFGAEVGLRVRIR